MALALNGQQFAPLLSQGGFGVYSEPPPAHLLSPLRGHPGTLVHVHGEGLGGGCEYACRFAGVGIVAATYDAARADVRCIAPSTDVAGTSVAAVELSLNGQQFAPTGLNFTFEAV